MVVLAHAATSCPPPLVRVDLGHNHELVTPSDHGMFVGIVTPFISRMLSLKTDFPRLTF
jgi:hypothetical protein